MDISTHGRKNAPSELLRLLRVLIDRLTDPELADRRWQYCHADELAEKMYPLWNEVGISSPGFWVDRGSDYGLPTPCELLHVRHPDLNEITSTTLEHGDGKGRFVAKVKDAAVVVGHIQAWVAFLEAQSKNRELEIELAHAKELSAIRNKTPEKGGSRNKWSAISIEEVESQTPKLPDNPSEGAEWLAFINKNHEKFPHTKSVMEKDREKGSGNRYSDALKFGISGKGYRYRRRSNNAGSRTYYYIPDVPKYAE
jgi:hypothetical protein